MRGLGLPFARHTRSVARPAGDTALKQCVNK